MEDLHLFLAASDGGGVLGNQNHQQDADYAGSLWSLGNSPTAISSFLRWLIVLSQGGYIRIARLLLYFN